MKTGFLIGLATVALYALMAFPGMFLWNIAVVKLAPMFKEASWGDMFALMLLVNVFFNTKLEVNSK